MKVEEIKKQVEEYKARGLKLFTSSSFQTHSLTLLHILSEIDNTIPVYFLNTGYHFPETLNFRDQIADLFKLDVRNVYSATPKTMQRDSEGRLLYISDPDHCCDLNKTKPMEAILMENDVWINGVRADQSDVRKSFQTEQPAPYDTLRFHPMLDWSPKMVYDYLRQYNIPKHPLDEKGYSSIGCEPCTRKFDSDTGRDGRWFGMKKTECGLHTNLAVPK